jgi:hypothetical protein
VGEEEDPRGSAAEEKGRLGAGGAEEVTARRDAGLWWRSTRGAAVLVVAGLVWLVRNGGAAAEHGLRRRRSGLGSLALLLRARARGVGAERSRRVVWCGHSSRLSWNLKCERHGCLVDYLVCGLQVEWLHGSRPSSWCAAIGHQGLVMSVNLVP